MMLKERRLEQVFQSGIEVFSQKGFHKASISDIVRRAGIARATFYLYFKNKRHLLSRLLGYLLQELDQRIKSIELGEGQPPPLEQLRANLTRIITFGLEEPQLIQMLFRHDVGLDEDLDQELHRFYERVTDRIEWALRLGIEMGLVRACHTKVIAYSVLGGIKEVMKQIASKQISALDVQATVESLLEFGLRGVLVGSVER